jgi:hypothetical protein
MNEIYFEKISLRPDIFPPKWHCKNVERDDVEWITGAMNRSSQLSTKSKLNSSYWKKINLDKLIESYGDAWNYDGQTIICVWEISQKEKEPPIGFISFDIAWKETKTQKVHTLFLTVNLIWVRPDKRGLGGVAARHIATHLIFYLENWKLIPPYVPTAGVNVFYYADFDSLGGEKISYIIQESLEVLKDNQIWKIKQLDFDVGI